MGITTFLKLIRWKNLLLIIYIQILIKFIFFETFPVATNLSTVQFIILLFSVLFISAAGNIINDIFDIQSDLINKPTEVIISKFISEEGAKKLYLYINTVGLVLGISLCLNIQKPSLSFIFIGASLLLYFYSKKIKGQAFIGNISVSFLIAIMVLLLVIFDLDFTVQNNQFYFIKGIIYVLSFFAFTLNLIRELIKDIEDVNGDYKLKMNTLPILIGRDRAKQFAFILCLIPIGLLLFIILNYSMDYKILVLYLLLFTLIPMLYIIFKLPKSKSKKDFQKLSSILKLIMFFGLNILLIMSLNF
jgi:4-hydroxybenzoate polyprenyltransferase